MDLPLGDFRHMSVAEFDTTKLLAHAAKQADERDYKKFPIVDVDSHHYESESLQEILEYMDDPVLQQLAKSASQSARTTGMFQGGVGYQDMGGRVTRYPLRKLEKGEPGEHRDVSLTRRWMDAMGVDISVLFPTPMLQLGLHPQVEVEVAMCRAYNRWIADFCRDSDGRLVPIAHLSLGDPAAAAAELERAVKDGCKGAFVAPFTITKIAHGDKAHDRVFAAAQDLDVPLAVHPTFEPTDFAVHHRFDNFRWAVWYFDLFAGQGVQHAFATFFQCGTFDRFPGLKVVVLESGAGWIGYFFDRADAIYSGTSLGGTVRLKEKPSHYFKERCFISADPDERTIAGMMRNVGENKFFWASDYPHPDHPGNYLEELRGMVAPMSETGRRGILGENVARAYKLM